METWRLIIDDAMDASINMARDEAIALYYPDIGIPTLRFYKWSSPTVSIGHFQDKEDIHIGYCNANRIDIVRRPTGGRAILHHDEITYSISGSIGICGGRSILNRYRVIGMAIVNGLNSLNIKRLSLRAKDKEGNKYRQQYISKSACLMSSMPYEVVCGSQKIIGSAQKVLKDRFLQHGSIPLSLDLSMIYNCIKINCDKAFLTTYIAGLNDLVRERLAFKDVISALIKGFEETMDIRFIYDSLSPSEQRIITLLLKTKRYSP